MARDRTGGRAARREKIAHAAQMRDEGKSIPVIASEMGTTPTRVAAWLKEADSFNSEERFVTLVHPRGGFYYVNPDHVAWFTDEDSGSTKMLFAGDPEFITVREPVSSVVKKLSR